MTQKLTFWYEFASTYSYLSAFRVADMARAAGVELIWRPFLLGPVFAAQGYNDSPFNIYPVKGAYMWRDMARLCAERGLAFQRPPVFPQNTLLAARVAVAAQAEGQIEAVTQALYHAEFARGQNIMTPEDITAALEAAQLPLHYLEQAQTHEVKTRLKENTQAAMEIGVFGAPSFTVGDEVFWGDDRLEQALRFAVEGGST